MNDITLKQIEKVLSENKDVAFAYIFGSSAERRTIRQGSDLDMAAYFYKDPDLEMIHHLTKTIGEIVGEDTLDLLVLNGCEDFILRHEVLKGRMVFCRDVDIHASFYSWTIRMYEDQILRMKRYAKQKV